MKKSLLIILVFFGIRLCGQCSFTIVPSYTPASCPTCCDGQATFSLAGTGPSCGPFGYTLQPIGSSPVSGVWSNLCVGSYTFQWHDGGCCGPLLCAFPITSGSTGINERINENSVFSLFPNPTSDRLFILSDGEFELDTEIEIENYNGQNVVRSPLRNEMDISSLSNGIYFIRLENSKGRTERKRFVIAK